MMQRATSILYPAIIGLALVSSIAGATAAKKAPQGESASHDVKAKIGQQIRKIGSEARENLSPHAVKAKIVRFEKGEYKVRDAIFGAEARRQASLAIGGGLNFPIPGVSPLLVNSGVEWSYWFPSRAYRDWVKKTGRHDVLSSWAARVITPNAGVGLGNYIKLGYGVTPVPWLAAYFTQRTYGFSGGPRGYGSFSIGEGIAEDETQFPRGPYFGGTFGLPINTFTGGLIPVHPFIKFEFYHPMFGPLVHRMKPAAKRLSSIQDKAKQKLENGIHVIRAHVRPHPTENSSAPP